MIYMKSGAPVVQDDEVLTEKCILDKLVLDRLIINEVARRSANPIGAHQTRFSVNLVERKFMVVALAEQVTAHDIEIKSLIDRLAKSNALASSA